MLILDIPRRAPEEVRYIEVPVYHRPHLGLSMARSLHACLLPNAAVRSQIGKEPATPELLLSVVPFECWDRAWRLTLEVRDRPGLLHDLATVMHHFHAEMVFCESGATQEASIHSIEALFHIAINEHVERLRWALGAAFCKDMSFGKDEARLSVQPVHTLHHARRRYNQLQNDSLFATLAQSSYSFSPLHATVTVETSEDPQTSRHVMRARLEGPLRERVKQCVREIAPGHNRDNFGYLVRMSDTKDRYLRVLFLRQSDPFIHARIEYIAGQEAYVGILGLLKQGGYNVLSSSLTHSGGRRTRLEVVAHAPVALGPTIDDIKDHLRLCLAEVPGRPEITLTFPSGYQSPATAEPIECTNPHPFHAVSTGYFFQGLENSVEAALGDLERDIDNGSEDVDLRQRKNFLRDLNRKFRGEIRPKPARTLFISARLAERELKLAAEVAKRHGFIVFTGDDVSEDPSLRQGIVTRIDGCSHFLGVWTLPDGPAPPWPSPWVVWEAGVAEAGNKVTALLVDHRLLAEVRRVYYEPEILHFGADDFEAQLHKAIKQLAHRLHR